MFNFVETIIILIYIKIISDSFRNKIIDKLFTFKSIMHIHLNKKKHVLKLLLSYSNTWNHLRVS